MIKTTELASRIATDLETDCVLNDYLAQYKKPSRIFLGMSAESPAWTEDECPLIAIAPADADTDFGGMIGARQIPILIRWAVYDTEITDDGRRVTFHGVSRCDDIGHEIARVIKARAVTEGGNCASIQYRAATDPAKLPLCEGRMVAVFYFDSGMAEPELVTTEASA